MPNVTISHDAFGRYEIVRRSSGTGRTCRECGQPARFQYTAHADDNPRLPIWTDYVFCSVGCWRAYN